ncbi:MAG: adenylate/guanylate cyclase domain-containing protein [Pseudomonadota bacterium]
MAPSPKSIQACILLADISGSTRLYETAGDAEAQRTVGRELARLQAVIADYGGICIRQKGDDVLGYFAEPGPAFRAIRRMLQRPPGHVLSIHAGLHFGQVVLADGDIFGEAVNLTARLAALANADEALLSRSLFDLLSSNETRALRPLDRFRLKGVSALIEVFALADDDPGMQTAVFAKPSAEETTAWPRMPEASVLLTRGQQMWRCREAESLLLGRSQDCGIILSEPWISRRHAVLTVRDGKALLEDRSSSGTYVATGGGHQLFLRRETITLTGDGLISPAVRPTRPEAVPVEFRVVQR